MKGDCYVSAMGGGTCNSEFEFLTGSTMGMLGAGVYPYMLYDLRGADKSGALPFLYRLQDKRDSSRPEGELASRPRLPPARIDEFYDEDSFPDAEMFRGMVSDASTYDRFWTCCAKMTSRASSST